jgi:type VI protein secretion system component VasK
MAMDDAQMRTMMRGLTIGLGIYALGFVAPFLLAGQTGQWVAIVLTGLSLAFMLTWSLLVWRGMRWTKKDNRGLRRAKTHAKEEREKRMRMR